MLDGPDIAASPRRLTPPSGEVCSTCAGTDQAVTAEDYEAMVLRFDREVRRVRCVPGRNLDATDPQQRRAMAPARQRGRRPRYDRATSCSTLWSFLDDRGCWRLDSCRPADVRGRRDHSEPCAPRRRSTRSGADRRPTRR